MRVSLRTASLLVPKPTRFTFSYSHLSRHASSSSSSPSSPLLSDEIQTKSTRDRIQSRDDPSTVFEMPSPVDNGESTTATRKESPVDDSVVLNVKDPAMTSVKIDLIKDERSAAAAPTTSLLSTSIPELSSPSSSSLNPSSSAQTSGTFPTTNSTRPSSLPSTTSSASDPVNSTSYPHDLQSLLAAHPALAAQYNMLAIKATKVSARLQIKADELKQDTLRNLGMLGRKLNEFTGYDEIERLKQSVRDKEDQIALLRSKLLELKSTYLDSVTFRSTSQRELNDLLQRKHLWSTADVERFTSLVRADHENMRLEEENKKALEDAELEVERGFTEMMNSILNRYHEEQLWSDKLRSFSTYVSLTIMIANLVVFITAIVFVEPWKRKRMVESFEAKVEEMRAGLEEKLDAVGLGLNTRVGKDQNQEAREDEETKLHNGLDLTREVWEEIRLLRKERDQARLQVQLPNPTFSLSSSSSSSSPSPSSPSKPSPTSTDPTSSTSRPPIISLQQTYPYVTFSYPSLSGISQSIIQSTSHALSSTRSFLLTGWKNEGTERDLVVVGTGAAIGGGLIVGVLKEMMK